MITPRNAFEAQLAWSDRPILIGPWTSEVGFEVLYWLGYLSNLRRRLGLKKERLIACSRGGLGELYDAERRVDLLEVTTVQALRTEAIRRRLETGLLKQMSMTAWDRSLMADVAAHAQLKQAPLVLHPSRLYRRLHRWIANQDDLGGLLRDIDLIRVQMPPLLQLPAPRSYIVCGLYARATWPPTPETADYGRRLLAHLASMSPVILIDPPFQTDDHVPFIPKELPERVTRLSALVPMTPLNHLAVIAATIANSAAFVGTYGGLAQLALITGVPSVGLYTQWHGTAYAHLVWSQHQALMTNIPFTCLSLREALILGSGLPALALGQRMSS